MYQLHFIALDSIIKMVIKNMNNTLNDINTFITNEYDKYVNLEPFGFNKQV